MVIPIPPINGQRRSSEKRKYMLLFSSYYALRSIIGFSASFVLGTAGGTHSIFRIYPSYTGASVTGREQFNLLSEKGGHASS